MLTCGVCGVEIAEGYWPKELPLPERVYDRCEQHWHSTNSFVDMDLTLLPPEAFAGHYILGSSFGSQKPGVWRWPDGAKACVFERCMFLNCDPPPGSSILPTGAVTQYRAATDLQDWYIDENGNPTEPLDATLFTDNGWSTDSADIPNKPRVPGVPDA